MLAVVSIALTGCPRTRQLKKWEARPETSLPAIQKIAPGEGLYIHVVKKGETLYSISRRYSLSIEVIRRANGLGAGTVIEAGQRLRIPVSRANGGSGRSVSVGSSLVRLERYKGPRRAGMIRPLQGGRLLVRYGRLIKGVRSRGVTIGGEFGQAVWAMQDGVVRLRSDDFFGLGKVIGIEHAGGVWSLYGHLYEALVQVGDRVEQGQVIGRVGTSGRAERPQLHVRLYRPNGETVNPLDVMK